jgi:hypothetical protein
MYVSTLYKVSGFNNFHIFACHYLIIKQLKCLVQD